MSPGERADEWPSAQHPDLRGGQTRQACLARAMRKIDAAVALTMAVGRAQASDADPQPIMSSFFNDSLFV